MIDTQASMISVVRDAAEYVFEWLIGEVALVID